MTFPRRLTPSDKERATIVQQRMTPGAALGVGSRHVRSGTSPTSSSHAATSGGVASAATYGQNPTATARVGDYLNPVDWVDFTIGDYTADFDPATLHFLTDGLFQIATWANVDTTNGAHARLMLDLDASAIGNLARDSNVVYQGTAWLYCITPILEFAAGDILFPLWNLNGSDGTASGTNVWGQIRVVKFAS